MATELFDPYFKWLAIPPEEQPPHHYRLLGVPLFTVDADVIENSANQRMAHLRTILASDRAPFAQKLLNEVANARACLLHPKRKDEYDMTLRQQLSSIAAPLEPPPVPAVAFPAGSSPSDTTPSLDVATRSLPRRKKSTQATINLIGHIVAPIAGLMCGYLLICRISPSNDVLGIFRKSPRSSATSVHETATVKTAKLEPQLPAATTETSAAPKLPQPTMSKMPTPQVPDRKATAEKRTPTNANNVPSGKPGNSNAVAIESPAAQPEIAAAERKAKLSAILSEQVTAKTSEDFKRLASALLVLLQTAPVAERTELLEAHQDRLLLLARKSQDEQLTKEVTRIILALPTFKSDNQPDHLDKASADSEPGNAENSTTVPKLVESSGRVTFQQKVSAQTVLVLESRELPSSADTGIELKKGQRVEMKISGSWTIVKGQKDSAGPTFLTICLGQVGEFPTFMRKGDKTLSFDVTQSGNLFLGINDPPKHDNQGELTVEISVQNP